MKLPNWFKILWWIILIFITSFFICMRYGSLISGKTSEIDILIVIVWFCLLLAPLFNNIEILGIKLKQNIEDIKSSILDLKYEISNSINLKTQINPNFYVSQPPPDSKLSSIGEDLLKELKIYNNNETKNTDTSNESIHIDNTTQFLFSIKYTIEKETKRILLEKCTIDGNNRVNKTPLIRIAKILNSFGIINSKMFESIQIVSSICNLSIHGDNVTEEQYKFVKNVAPNLICTLQAL